LTAAKAQIVTWLTDGTNGVKVYDDTIPVPVALAGHVYDRYVGKGEFGAHVWTISVGPVIGAPAEIASLGSFNKIIKENVQIDVWVMEVRGATWAAEKTRQDVVQEVDRCLLHYANVGGSWLSVNVSSWREIDEHGMRRSSMTAECIYEKVRA